MIFNSMKVLLFCLVIVISLTVSRVSADRLGKQLIGQDIYQISRISCNPDVEVAYSELNNYLVGKTSSVEPQINFDIALERLILDLRERFGTAAKRLFLSLSTIGNEIKCDALSHAILYGNYCAGGRRIGSIKKHEALRRVEKIAWPIIAHQASACRTVYKNRYDDFKLDLNKEMLDQVEQLVDPAINKFISKEYPDQSMSNAEKLYNSIFNQKLLDIKLDIYTYLNNVATEDADRECLQPVDDERNGIKYIDKKKFIELYNKFVGKPCAYYVEKLGPEIFGPATFDAMFSNTYQTDYEEYYKAWLRYKLCSGDGKKVMKEAYSVAESRAIGN